MYHQISGRRYNIQSPQLFDRAMADPRDRLTGYLVQYVSRAPGSVVVARVEPRHALARAAAVQLSSQITSKIRDSEGFDSSFDS